METEAEKARLWRDKAEVILSDLANIKGERARQTLYEVAQTYLRMADDAEGPSVGTRETAGDF